MPRIYRVMTPDADGLPKVGTTARSLGVRVRSRPDDPEDIAVDSGHVAPGTGGMSVAPSWRDLPLHRIPQRLAHQVPNAAGRDTDACWRMGDGPFEAGDFAEGLSLRPDHPEHGVVEPSHRMTLDAYRAALAATRDRWTIDEE